MKSILIILTVFFLCFACATRNGMTSARKQPANKAALPVPEDALLNQAQALIMAGLDNTDYIVMEQAISMARYLPAEEVFPLLSRLLTEGLTKQNIAGFSIFRYTLLESLFALDPESTLQLLLADQEAILEQFALFRLFSIIGFDKIPLFDNLFYYLKTQDSAQGAFPAEPLILAELYLATGEKKYGDILHFYDYRGFTPDELLFAYSFLQARGLPVKELNLTMQYLAGNLGRMVKGVRKSGKSPALEDILYQALLYRLGLAAVVYNKQTIYTGNEIAETALRKYGLKQETYYEDQDLAHFSFSPYYLLVDAVAFFYAGVPEASHYRTLLECFPRFTDSPVQAAVARAILAAPDNAVKEQAVSFLAACPDAGIRHLVFSAFKKSRPKTAPSWLPQALETEQNSLNRALLLELPGSLKQSQYLALLKTALTGTDPLAALSAAGALLMLYGE